MTTGILYAAIFYFASLILTAVGGFVFFGGDAARMFGILSPVARLIGPLLIAPAGFIAGFFHEKHRQQRQKARLAHQAHAVSVAAAATPAPTIAHPVPEAPQPGQPMSEEVREYLKQTSAVDLKGIREFIEETRRHKLEDLPGGRREPES